MRCSTVATALVAVFISYLGAPAAVKAGGVMETDLVQNRSPLTDKNGHVHKAPIVDPHLVNPWGIATSPTSPFWVSDNNAGVTTLYNTAGTPQALVVSIPGCPPANPLGANGTPTGAVFNIDAAGQGFKISGVDQLDRPTSLAALFLFATEDGTIVGWNPGVNPIGFNQAGRYGIIAVPGNCGHASYKGLAIAQTGAGGAFFLYAANFQTGMVDQFETNFHVMKSFTGPNLEAGFSPFNVAVLAVNGVQKLFVTYAIRNPHTGNNVPGKGSGIVDVFDLDGNFLQRFAEGGHLKAPWGMAISPASFGSTLGGKLWIGNFGDGHINVFDPGTGAFIDQVRDTNGKTLVIDGLWSLRQGNGGNGGKADTLYFTAGPNGETDGVFGALTPNP